MVHCQRCGKLCEELLCPTCIQIAAKAHRKRERHRRRFHLPEDHHAH